MVGAVGLISCFSYLAASRFLRASVIETQSKYAGLNSEELPEKTSQLEIVISYNKKKIYHKQGIALLKFGHKMKEEEALEMLKTGESS